MQISVFLKKFIYQVLQKYYTILFLYSSYTYMSYLYKFKLVYPISNSADSWNIYVGTQNLYILQILYSIYYLPTIYIIYVGTYRKLQALYYMYIYYDREPHSTTISIFKVYQVRNTQYIYISVYFQSSFKVRLAMTLAELKLIFHQIKNSMPLPSNKSQRTNDR